MGLADNLATVDAKVDFGTRCKVCQVLESLDDGDRQVLEETLAEPKELRASSQIGEVLRSHGHDVGDDGIRRHRRGHK